MGLKVIGSGLGRTGTLSTRLALEQPGLAPCHHMVGAFMTGFFRKRTERVIASTPPERLLVFDVKEGWEALCAFLGVGVPVTPYPRENSTRQFQARIAAGVSPIDPDKVRASFEAETRSAS